MLLDEYILENVDLMDYYDKCVQPLDDRFKPHSFRTEKLVLCCFKDHQDINPSMGYMKSRNNGKVKLYHCFGCGKTGDVIKMHQSVEYEYHNRKLDRKEACYDLARIFGLELGEFEELGETDYDKRYSQSLIRIEKAQNNYSKKSFTKELLEIRKSGKVLLDGPGSINNASVKLIATLKQLYD